MMERRRRDRLELKLPIRLRWHGPLIPFLETTQTLDVSRAGLLILRPEPCRVKARLWVRFPFSSGAPLPQPETPARVAHVKAVPESGYLVGLAFDLSPDWSPGASPPFDSAQDRPNRRRSQRVCVALPVRARKADIRWPEETMTADVSGAGVRFPSARFYAAGDAVRVALVYRYESWVSAEEFPGRVVRVEPVPDSTLDSVAVKLAASIPAEEG